ncbi:MAG: hypothetical protein JST89_20240 [Cyanobacteria bacterium SZAS-4]|nr:hypothetical protein [Cyanobacteria bacterium SZAS-4]
MTGTSDVPEEEHDKIVKDLSKLDAIDRVIDRRAKCDQTASANEEFGKEMSVPMTWDTIVHGNSLGEKLTDKHYLEADTVQSDLDRFIQTLNENGFTSLSWQYSFDLTSPVGRVEKFVVIDSFSAHQSSDEDDDENDEENDDTTDSIGERSGARLDAEARSVHDQQIHRARSSGSAGNADHPVIVPAKPFMPAQKRFILGSEIALAVIVAAAGATRLRSGVQRSGPRVELIPGDNTRTKRHSSEIPQEQTEKSVVSNEKMNLLETADISKQKGAISVQKAIRPKTLVASTDTLVSIAEAFFYDKNIAWLIADINQALLKETWMDDKRIVELKSRQQIELPLKEDIERFYSSRPEHARAENLITIVEETAVDLELLNNSLGDLLDSKQE